MPTPRATYRLQLHAGFTFRQAAEIAPYLARLGVSHVYLSPFFKARPGSTHGYDITNHAELNPELGDEADYRAMIAAYDSAGLGRLLDFVPNHMGVGGADNPAWLDVLEWGPESSFAAWFDIDWEAQNGKLLAPVLGSQYGEELRNGHLKLKFEPDGGFAVWAYDQHKLPLCPLTYPDILGRGKDELDAIADLFLDLPRWRPECAKRALSLKSSLSGIAEGDEKLRGEIAARVNELNANWRELGRLIDKQFWRVAFYRVAEDEINYRRFFNINDLAGLRIEFEPAFEASHARIFQMLKEGDIDGLRIDHVDGLFDPSGYLRALTTRPERPDYLVVEKILATHESLREEWPVDGTTGYDFLNLVLGVLIDASADAAFTEIYRDFTGDDEGFETVARASKLRIMENEMSSELNRLARAAARLARQSPMTTDLTPALLLRAIKEIVAAFPIYRTYVDFSGVLTPSDRRDLTWAFARARRADPEIHPSAFDFLQTILMAEVESEHARELSRMAAMRLAMQFQQFSGPVMAKGIEDTAFYRFNRFIALNEVGGAPETFGLTPAAFHKTNQARAERWPRAMLATATHDTKRGEDARARLAVLSEIPDEWRRMVTTWSGILRTRRGEVERKAAPDRTDEYLFYQMLVGVWPMDMVKGVTAEGLEALGERLQKAIEKSLRESKLRSSWTSPNAEYEDAMQSFARDALSLEPQTFWSTFLPFIERVARFGVENSLVQTVLKLTAPGVPDIYQGSDLWDFSLVDPDNRRPVDFAARECALGNGGQTATVENGGALDGRVKLETIAMLLNLRRDDPDLFLKGDYQPLMAEGEEDDWALGFVRTFEDRRLAVIVARYPAHRAEKPDWAAHFALPEGNWRNVVTDALVKPGRPAREWLAGLPFAICAPERQRRD